MWVQQFEYWDEVMQSYVGGIKVGDTYICACCGAEIDIDDLEAPDEIPAIRMFDDWIDIEAEIRGDE